MGGAALAICIAMARTAEASTSGKKKDRVDAMWRDPAFVAAVGFDQYDDLGRLTQSQLTTTRPVARATLETDFPGVLQTIWTAHLRRTGSQFRMIDATLNNADHLPDPDPDNS